MANHSSNPSDVDPQTLENCSNFWHGFMRFSMAGIVAVIVILALMAWLLV